MTPVDSRPRWAWVAGLLVVAVGGEAHAACITIASDCSNPMKECWEVERPNCDETVCRFYDGDEATYHFLDATLAVGSVSFGPLGTSLEGAIDAAVSTAWGAGPSDVSRGASWAFVRGDDVDTMSFTDDLNQVSMSADFFDAMGMPSNVIAATVSFYRTAINGCGVKARDVVFDGDQTWTTARPAAAAANAYAIGQTAIHEFGHLLGFDHTQSTSTLSVMWGQYPFGGDVSASWRIHETDYVNLADAKPGTSTGINLSVSRFHFPDATFGGREAWDAEDWCLSEDYCEGEEILPSGVAAEITGTSGASGVDIDWYLRPLSDPCGGTYNVLLAHQSWTMSVNGPAWAEPTLIIPSGTPPGDYKLCTIIDGEDEVSETSEGDNVVGSEVVLHVLNAALYGNCPASTWVGGCQY